MAGELTTTITFADGDQITSAKLNQIISGASFSTDAVTGTTLTVTGGKLKVGTITASELGASAVTTTALNDFAVTTAKIYDGNITAAKMANASVGYGIVANNSLFQYHMNVGAYATKEQAQAQTATYIMDAFNSKYTLGEAKAYGEFSIVTTSRAIKSNSYNISSFTRIDSTHTTVTLTNNMSSEFYTVMATFVGDDAQAVGVYGKAAGSFKIRHPAESAGRAINFVVFGKY
jgi:hypothetical protein